MIKRSGLCLFLATLVFPDRAFAPLPPQFKPIRQQNHQPQELRSASPGLKAQAKAYLELGRKAWEQRDLPGALTAYEASLVLWQKHGADTAGHADTLAELGEVLLEVGQTDAALGRFKEAADLLDRQDNRDIRFKVVIGGGMVYLDRGNTEIARFIYERALDIAVKPADKALAYHRLGTALYLLQNLPEAEEALDKSLKFARNAGSIEKAGSLEKAASLEIEGYALADRAHVYDLMGREREALLGFDQARQIFRSLPRDRSLYVASTLLGTSEVLRDLGRFEEAIDAIEESIGLMEQVRSTLSPGDRIGFFALRHRYYEYRIQLLMDQARLKPRAGYAVEAFYESESSKARSLLDELAGVPLTKGLTLKEIQSELLDKDSLLLSYSLGKDESFLWVVGRDRISVHSLPPRGVLEEAALQTWRALSGRNLSEAKKLAMTKNLAQMLLPKEIGSITGKRLLVSPDGLLHLIPFALLEREKNKILLEDHVITHIPSASVLVSMRRKLASRRPAPKDFAGLGDPVFSLDDVESDGWGASAALGDRGVQDLIGPLPRLEHSREEILNVVKLFPEDAETFTALGFQANRDTVFGVDLSKFQMLHFATHHFAEGHPAFTGIVLSLFDERGRPRPGFVTAQEIYNLDLPAELAVLSACGTGLGKDVRGEGPVGLTRAFLRAGAKRVVVSLWSVNDQMTAVLMERFYSQMLNHGKSPAEALREAQLSVYRQGRGGRKADLSWGAFVLQGEPR